MGFPGTWSILVVLTLSLPAQAQISQQGSKLVGAGYLGNPGQGFSVALSADGNTAIVGGYTDDTSAFAGFNLGQGASWIFTRSGDSWRQQGPKLIGSSSSQTSSQGFSVSLSADGNTAVISGSEGVGSAGAIWFFTRFGGVWSQQGSKISLPFILPPPFTSSQSIFTAVALSADGNTAVAASRGLGTRVFTRAGGVWTQQALLVGTGMIGTALDVNFGSAVSISGDGNTIAIGAPTDGNRAGATYVFARTNGQWTQQGQKVVGSGVVGQAAQGLKVALSTDGNTLAVTGSADHNNFGAAWFFTRSAGVWTQQGGKAIPSDVTTNWIFGEAVALSGDGNTAFIGGYSELNYNSALWVFGRTGGVWTQRGPHFYGTGITSTGVQCCALAISADGNTFIAGAAQDNAPGPSVSGVGAAWIFVRNFLQFTAPATAVAGLPVTLGVSAVGPNNVVSSGYDSALRLSSSDPQAVLPQDAVLANSSGTFVTTFRTPGPQTIAANLATTPLVTGTSNAILVRTPAVEISPLNLTLQYTQGNDPATGIPGTFTVSAEAPISFTASAADSWITLSPASGTTPAAVAVRPNPAGLDQGSHSTVITLRVSDGRTYLVPVTLVVAAQDGVTALANSASFAAGPGAPNTLVSAFGRFAGCTSNAQVSIDRAVTSVFASSPTQINFLVPPEVSGKPAVNVQITCAGTTYPPVSLPVAIASPAIFTALQSGTGEAASVSTPSASGTIITLYGTGFGLLGDRGQDGLAHTLLPMTASVGGESAAVLYAGEAPGYTSGLQQINILIPRDLLAGPGVPVRLVLGGFNTQAGVTVTIQ